MSGTGLLVKVPKDKKGRFDPETMELIYYSNDPEITGKDPSPLFEVKHVLRRRGEYGLDPLKNYELFEKPILREISKEERQQLVETYPHLLKMIKRRPR